MMNYYALIVAGGIGKRMQSEVPKQFILLNNKPILMHTIEKFYHLTAISCNILLVLPKIHIPQWKNLCEKYDFNIPHQIIEGGKERFYSVKNGLDTLSGNGLIAIHDGVRPFVSDEVIYKAFKTAKEKGNAIPAIPLTESIRKVSETRNQSVLRSDYRLIQTPQTFQLEQIKKAYNLPYDTAYTDDASVLEKYGQSINLIDGNKENIKITTPFDLKIGEVILKASEKC